MKKLILTTVAGLTAAVAFGQGTINFNTQALLTTAAQIRDAAEYGGGVIGDTAGTRGFGVGVNGTNFFVQLWVAPGANQSVGSLVPANNNLNSGVAFIGNFRNGANAGYSQITGLNSLGQTMNQVVSVPGATGGGPATFQVRAWYSVNSTITTWAQALVAFANGDANIRIGQSALFNAPTTGDPNGAPPTNPVNMVGFTGFQLTAPGIVPEPGTLALAGLGAASLLLFRRKK